MVTQFERFIAQANFGPLSVFANWTQYNNSMPENCIKDFFFFAIISYLARISQHPRLVGKLARI